MNTVRKYLDQASRFLCVSIFGFLVVLVTYQVITRYVFSKPSAWSEQLARYLFVWLVLIAAPYVFGKREHMNVGFFINKLPLKVKTSIEIFNELLIGVFMVMVLIYGGYQAVLLAMPKMDTALPISMGIITLILPISGVITLFYTICNIHDLTKQFLQKDADTTQLTQDNSNMKKEV